MKIPEKLQDIAVSDTGFVFDPYTGATFTVNQTGRIIFDGLKEGRDRPAIVESLREHFEVRETDDLQRDLDEFVQRLRQLDVVPDDFDL
jgi:PqqD family protein of HPr-rel-A system